MTSSVVFNLRKCNFLRRKRYLDAMRDKLGTHFFSRLQNDENPHDIVLLEVLLHSGWPLISSDTKKISIFFNATAVFSAILMYVLFSSVQPILLQEETTFLELNDRQAWKKNFSLHRHCNKHYLSKVRVT